MFEQYKDANNEFLWSNLERLKKEYKLLIDAEAKITKTIRKGLIWYYLIPFFGIFIYRNQYDKRMRNDEIMGPYLEIKNKVGIVELEILFIKRKIEDLNKTNNNDKDDKDDKE